jgi:hypothetical protein
MRKVLFKGWEIIVTGQHVKLQDDFSTPGVFHQWSTACSEQGNYTVAIIELEDGTVTEVPPIHIKFIS